MKKLSFGKPVETADGVYCDFCDEKKECFVGITRKVKYLVPETETEWQTVGKSMFSYGTPMQTLKSVDWTERSEEMTFHICPDCVGQLNKFTKELE